MDLDLFGEELSSDEEVNQQPKHTEENSNNNVDDVDLFGEDLSDDEEDTGASKGKEQENSNSNGSADKEGDKVLDDQLNQLFDDFEQGDSSTFVESELVGAEGAAVNVPVPAIKDLESSKLAVLKFPNVIRLKEDAYNAETFETNKELAYAYFIRWRWAQDQMGNKVKESNTRLVKWDDGSYNLFIGDECYQVNTRSVDQKKNFLYRAHPDRPELKKCVGNFSEFTSFRPMSIDSVSHKKLKDMIAVQHTRRAKLQRLNLAIDPEALRERDIKAVREKENEQNRKRTMKRKDSSRQKNAMSLDFLEKGMGGSSDDDDEEEEFLGTKRRAMNDEEEADASSRLLGAKSSKYEEDEEDTDDSDSGKKKRKRDADDSDADLLSSDDDDANAFDTSEEEEEEEEEEQPRRRGKSKKRRL